MTDTYAPVRYLRAVPDLHAVEPLPWWRMTRRWRGLLGAAVVSLAMWTGVVTLVLPDSDGRPPRETVTGPNLAELGLVHICAWPDKPNPSHLPTCAPRTPGP